jgi:MOSC domain-containing protein YiiM
LKAAGEVVHIFVAPKRGAPMAALAAVEALRDKGLAGDRYTVVASRHTANYQVTLIELENVEAFARDTGLVLTPEMPRRNIVTRGVRLNELVGKRFFVGGALLEGAELCEPCTLFAKRTHREVLKGLAGRGGLRARVLEGGSIRVGDPVGGEASQERALAHHNNHPSEGI